MRELYLIQPEESFDQPIGEDALPLIASGLSLYARSAKRLTEYYTGDADVMLTGPQEYELAEKIQAGKLAAATLDGLTKASDTDNEQDVWYRAELRSEAASGVIARTQLIECNVRLAAFFARASMGIVPATMINPSTGKPKERIGAFGDITKLKSPYASLEDRISVANLGLIDAVDKYLPKPNKSGHVARFSTYAAWRIQQHLYRHVGTQESPGLNFPAHIADMMHVFINDEAENKDRLLEQQNLRTMRDTVSLEQVATQIYAREEVEDESQLLAHLEYPEVVIDGVNAAPDEYIMEDLLRQSISSVLMTLSEREAGVIALRFGLADDVPKTLDEIGLVYGVTRERIRQIESKTMSKLRHSSRSSTLRMYLDDDNRTHTSENGLWGQQSTSPVYKFPSFLLQPTDKTSSFSGVPVSKPTTGGLRENWKVDPDEEWDAPVRATSEEIQDSFDNAGREFNRIMHTVTLKYFEKTSDDATQDSIYPVELIEEIVATCGVYLRPYHIEEFWNGSIASLIDDLETTEENGIDLDRVSLFFSHLLAERMSDDDVVSLHIPAKLQGKLNYFGMNLGHGKLIVNGNLGDYVGYRIQSLATIQVVGSVGDYAASEATGYSAMEVEGNAGKAFAYKATDGTLSVRGHIETLALAPYFIGDVEAGTIGHTYVGAPEHRIALRGLK